MSSSNDSNSRSYYSKTHHYHKRERHYRDYSKSKNRYYKRSRSRERERENSKYRKSNRDEREKKSHSKKSNNNIIINKSNIISQEKKTEEEIALERMKRKAKAQLLIMLDNEEKIRNEENNLKKEEEDILEEKVNNTLSNNIHNEIGIDPLDQFMQDFHQKNKIVKQIETFDDQYENKNTITLEEINKTLNENEEDNDQDEESNSYHDEFLNTINNTFNEEKAEKNKPNANSEAMVLYDEDHYEYKNNLSQNNDIDNIWKLMKNNIDKEKDLKPVDHSKMNYDFFTKNIYIESPEISQLTPEEIIEIRKSNGSILVKGKDIPKPILEFYQCGLSTKIIEILDSKEIKKTGLSRDI